MIVIDSRLPTQNLLIYRSLGRLIQGFIYTNLPPIEHEGFRHKSGKVFKRMNFDFNLQKEFLRIRYRSYLSEYEEKIALAILKDGLKLGEIHLSDTTVSLVEHKSQCDSLEVSGYVVCALKGLLNKKVCLEPNDLRHLENMKTNLLQRYETFVGKEYSGELKLELMWQAFNNPKLFYYGNNNNCVKAWKARWQIKAENKLINLMLDTGVGSGCMSVGSGVLDVVE